MTAISLRLNENTFNDTENVLSKLKTPRNKYINEAIDFYNKIQKQKLLEKQIEMESKLVQEDSMLVLAEFEALEDDI